MKRVFNTNDLEDIKFCLDNEGVKEAFCLVNNLDFTTSVPIEDLIDFSHQFNSQYRQTFGCSY